MSLLMPALAWQGLQWAILRTQGHSALARAIGRDLKGKLSLLLYVIGIMSAFFDTRLAGGIYLAVALLWLVPDRRIERTIQHN